MLRSSQKSNVPTRTVGPRRSGAMRRNVRNNTRQNQQSGNRRPPKQTSKKLSLAFLFELVPEKEVFQGNLIGRGAKNIKRIRDSVGGGSYCKLNDKHQWLIRSRNPETVDKLRQALYYDALKQAVKLIFEPDSRIQVLERLYAVDKNELWNEMINQIQREEDAKKIAEEKQRQIALTKVLVAQDFNVGGVKTAKPRKLLGVWGKKAVKKFVPTTETTPKKKTVYTKKKKLRGWKDSHHFAEECYIREMEVNAESAFWHEEMFDDAWAVDDEDYSPPERWFHTSNQDHIRCPTSLKSAIKPVQSFGCRSHV